MNVQVVRFDHPEAPRQFAQSLRETGFAVLANHPIPQKLIYDTYSEWERFFASPAKHSYRFDPVQQTGYFPFRSENAKDVAQKDLKEFFHYYPSKMSLPATTQEFTPEYCRRVTELASTMLGWLQQVTPESVRSKFSEPLDRMIQESEETLLRVIHYPPLSGTEEEGAVRAAAHEDINLITLLPAATQAGLQVRDTRGNWHDVPCDPGTFAINCGDMLQMASGGYYPSTTHRVMNPTGAESKKPRFSMPLFLHPRRDVRLSDQHTSRSYLDERLTEIGLLKNKRG